MYWWGIPASLVALCTIGWLLRHWQKSGTPLFLLANWIACTTVVYLTDDQYPVLFFIVADYLTGLALFAIRVSHWQTAIMVIYGFQLICHAAYALSGMTPAATFYSYWSLTYMAWAQVVACGGWLAHDALVYWVSVDWSRFNVASRASSYLAREKTR